MEASALTGQSNIAKYSIFRHNFPNFRHPYLKKYSSQPPHFFHVNSLFHKGSLDIKKGVIMQLAFSLEGPKVSKFVKCQHFQGFKIECGTPWTNLIIFFLSGHIPNNNCAKIQQCFIFPSCLIKGQKGRFFVILASIQFSGALFVQK